MDFLKDSEFSRDQPVGALSPQPWMSDDATRQLLEALSAQGTVPRFVGGCVRDALAHRPVSDIDLATPDRPEQVLRLLTDAGLRGIPTGLAHGTVTALVGRQTFEITSLREDIETDGRHATVRFVGDWVADAARRDFTINALSATADGMIYDPFGGIADLAEGRIRFVGDAGRRIDEDRLRLLRYFRFFAQFGRPPADIEALAACRRHAALLGDLSGERVRAELMKLLGVKDPLPALLLMQGAGVLAALLPEAVSLGPLRMLCFLEERGILHPAVRPDPLRRLACLLPAELAPAQAVARRLRLSNSDADRLSDLAAPSEWPGRHLPAPVLRRLLYDQGAALFRDLTLLAWARARAQQGYQPRGDSEGWRALLDLGDGWTPPVFPLSGADILALGVTPGPEVGRLLAAAHSWWIDRDFIPDRAALLARLEGDRGVANR